MPLVIIESPFAGEVERNILYGRLCVRDSLMRGESPFAGHLLYTQEGVLRDHIPEERRHGIDAHISWIRAADFVGVYSDYGVSPGMNEAIRFAMLIRKPVKYRLIFTKENGYE